MSNLVPFSGNGGLLPSRQLSRALDRVQAAASLEIAEVRASEAVELAKIEALGAAGDTVLREAARLSLTEAVYAAAAPGAEGRLRFAGDVTVTQMTDRVVRLNRRLG